MELPGGDGDWLAPSPSPSGPAVPDRHDEHGVDTFTWPKTDTSTWPPVVTFSWPRTGEAVKLLSTLERLAVRHISDRYLSEQERIGIADLRRTGMSLRTIADTRGREPWTISQKLRRNGRRDGQYRPYEAHRWHPASNPSPSAAGRQECRPMRPVRRAAHSKVECPTDRPLPAKRIYPDDPSMWLCHGSIYQAVYQHHSGSRDGPLYIGSDTPHTHLHAVTRHTPWRAPAASLPAPQTCR